MENGKVLHIVMFPWLAMGHLVPFLSLSELLAQKGHKVSFISTPRNLLRLPKLPPNLSSHITLIPLPLPDVPSLPSNAESTMDISYSQQQLLKAAFDLLQSPLSDFLNKSAPVDWVIYDYASHWLPTLAAELGISRAFFSLFTAACLSFIGPPSALTDGRDSRATAEDFTVVPSWVPFESTIVYRLHEVAKYVGRPEEYETGPSDTDRFRLTVHESDVVLIRSSPELEPEWFNLLNVLYKKPLVPVGFLPPLVEHEEKENDDKWVGIVEWLEKQRVNSVVYVALGSEVTLGREELSELALGLEKSGQPFFWVLRDSPGSTRPGREMLPDGFEERVKGRGIIYREWAPQVKILSHESVGGFLTHCGWNSVVEGLGLGKVLILFPVLNDQGLNARLLGGKKLGVEIARDERDGSFTSESVAKSVRLAMVDEPGDPLRVVAKAMRGLVGDKNRNAYYVDELAGYLVGERIKRPKPTKSHFSF